MRYKFIDEAQISISSGKGGAGCVSFRREKFIPRGGPDGGDGGRGGDVIAVVDPGLGTLLDFRYQRRHFAENGRPGEGRQCTGRDGETMVIRVPCGTVIYNDETGELLADLADHGDSVTLAGGGRGGKGNEHFKSSTQRTPSFAQPGEPGEEFELRLELKLLADVGLVGMPSVGKSSLIARISAAKPKIADYPFTTLSPNLGVVRFGVAEHYVVADVPGLIPGASEGAGLGDRFLRHIERVSHIAHLVSCTAGDDEQSPIDDFIAIERELCAYDPRLAELPRVLVLNKTDLPDVRQWQERLEVFAAERDLKFFPISAATGEGITELVNHLGERVQKNLAN